MSVHEELLAFDAADDPLSRHLHCYLAAWEVSYQPPLWTGKAAIRWRRARGVQLGKPRRRSLEEVRLNPHRADYRHADPFSAEGSAKPLGEAHHGELGGRIGNPQSWGHQAGSRGDIYDVATAALEHVRQHRPHQSYHAPQVHAQGALPVLVGEQPEVSSERDSGVVNQDVDLVVGFSEGLCAAFRAKSERPDYTCDDGPVSGSWPACIPSPCGRTSPLSSREP
jgi:hypothetical protein